MASHQFNFESGTTGHDVNAAADPSFEESQFAIILKELADEQYDQVIRNTSHLIDRPSSTAARALELRASAWERKANLGNELEDALLLIEYDANNIDAYLRAGRIYSIQGKQQRAIEVLNQGLQVSEDQRVLLTRHIAIAMAKAQRRIDFINQVPYDVLAKVISYLDIDAVNTSMDVCRTWHSKILECPESWREIVTSGTSFWRRTRAVNLLPTISKYIEKIDTYANPQTVARLFASFAIYDVSRLQSLILYDDYHADDCDISSSVNHGLPFVAQTLTELKLDSLPIVGISMGKILSTCQRLTSISLHVGSITECSSVMSLSHDTSLTAVKISTVAPIVALSNFRSLFQHSPRLCDLEIHSQEIGGDILLVLEHYCPELAVISIRKFPLIEPFRNVRRSKCGEKLHHLSLYNIQSAELLLPRLASSCNTLRTMALIPADGDDDPRSWQPLSSFVFIRLTYLHISTYHNRAFCEHLPEILHACPSIKTLEMDSTRHEPGGDFLLDQTTQNGDGALSLDTHRIFNAVTEMHNLFCLRLTHFCIRGSAFKQYLERHAVLGDNSTLRELEVYWCAGLDGDILQAAGKIRNLEKLQIRGPGSADNNSVLLFVTSVSKLPRLSNLQLGEIVFTDEMARILATSRSLAALNLLDVQSLTQDGWKVLHDRIPFFNRVGPRDFRALSACICTWLKSSNAIA